MSRRKPEYSRDSRRYYDWLDRAGEDILAAGWLKEHDSCYNAAAFHCQQVIEKALKAYILLKSDILADGHNLPWLCKRAMRYDSRFAEWLDESASLNKCYIETRYPADLAPGLDYSRVRNYYQMARAMYLFICAEVDATVDRGRGHPGQKP
jgi:HEPN domain-containing protein